MGNVIKEKKKYVLVYCTNGDPKKTGIIEIDGKPWTEDLGKIDLFTSKYNSNLDLFFATSQNGNFRAAVDAHLDTYEKEIKPFWEEDDQSEEEDISGFDVFVVSLGKEGEVNVLDPIYKCSESIVLNHDVVINGKARKSSKVVDLYANYVRPLCSYIEKDENPRVVGFPKHLNFEFSSAIKQVGSNLPVLATPYFDAAFGNGDGYKFLERCHLMTKDKPCSLSYEELRNMVSFLTTYYPFAFRKDVDCVDKFSKTRNLRLKVADIGLVIAGLNYVQPTLFDFGLEPPTSEEKGKK